VPDVSKKTGYEIMYAQDDDGWTEWVAPTQPSYMMECCDCGLVHEFEFDIGDADNGRKGVPVFRARRIEDATE